MRKRCEVGGRGADLVAVWATRACVATCSDARWLRVSGARWMSGVKRSPSSAVALPPAFIDTFHGERGDDRNATPPPLEGDDRKRRVAMSTAEVEGRSVRRERNELRQRSDLLRRSPIARVTFT